MNSKKSLLWRAAIVLAILVGWIYSLFPLQDQDYLQTFRNMAGDKVDAEFEAVFQEAQRLSEPYATTLAKTAEQLPEAFQEATGVESVDLAELFAVEAAPDNATAAVKLVEAGADAPIFWDYLRGRAGPENELANQFVEAAQNMFAAEKMPLAMALAEAATDKGLALRDYVGIYKKPKATNRQVAAYVQRRAEGKLRLGLDLRGGTEFIVGFNADDIPADEFGNKMPVRDVRDSIIEIIRNRIDQSGVLEPEIRPIGDNTISIKVPSVTPQDVEQFRTIISKSAVLEFREVYAGTEDPDTAVWEKMTVRNLENPEKAETLWVKRVPEKVGGANVSNARVNIDEFGNYEILLAFDNEGREWFGETTTRLAPKSEGGQSERARRLAIVLDGVLHSAPVINEPIPGGRAVISGSFTREEAFNLQVVLRSGNLPVNIAIQGEFGTNPTLGAATVQSGKWAAIAGLALVAAFMIAYYGTAGIIAVFALTCNVILVLGTMPILNATITLPGLAGIVLTIGMAVDANVLIFERIKEELANGKSMVTAIRNGYSKAFSTILDANLTTFFTALILMKFGSGPIRGFAVTLSVGILASMFTALFMTRLIFDALIEFGILKSAGIPSWTLTRRTFNFIRVRNIALTASAVAVAVAILIGLVRGENALSVDFRSGAAITYTYNQQVPLANVRQTLENAGYDGAQATYKFSAIGATKLLEVLIQDVAAEGTEATTEAEADAGITTGLAEQVARILNDAHPELQAREGTTNAVGGLVGERFRTQALWTILGALVVIVIYITFRFEFAYAIGAVAALIHDVAICTGIFLLPLPFLIGYRQLSLTVIAGLLTIIGYSLNDTIVVFDRIRENLSLADPKRMNFLEILNDSINQTLSRTLLTSLTTLFVVLTLYFFGGGAINDFALIMMLGVIVGTYSSIFVATPVMILYTQWRGSHEHAMPDERKPAPSATT